MKKLVLLGLAVILLCVSCFLPEKFTATISIKSDGSYVFTYKGTMAYTPALMMMSDGSKLDAQADADFKTELAAIAKEAGVSKYTYLGNGRFEFEYTQKINSDGTFNFYDESAFITIIKSGKALKIIETASDAGTTAELLNAGYKLNGTLIIESELPITSSTVGFEVKKSGNKTILTQRIQKLSEKEIQITAGNFAESDEPNSSAMHISDDFFR